MVDETDPKREDPNPEDLDPNAAAADAGDVDSGHTEEAAAEPTAPPTAEEALEKLTDKLRRVEAEFVNETKRIRRKAEEDRKYAIEGVVVDLLPVVDALAGARDGLPDDEASAPMREGLALVEQQLQAVFKRYGIAAIEAQDKPFDPSRHQALLMVEREDVPPQTVCDVMRVGYELHGRVIRPSEVLVAKAPTAAVSEDDASPETGEEGV